MARKRGADRTGRKAERVATRAPGASRAPHRFAALDGWRGLCACLVALYHWRGQLGFQIVSHVGNSGVVAHAYLFVDFFFVLSGFVIAAAYARAIAERAVRVRDFIALRLGRIYPLHFFTLVLTVLLVRGALLQPHWWIGFRMPPKDVSLEAFVENAALLQGMHTTPSLTWNHPSWSISAEFWTYVVFAGLWFALRKRAWIASAALIVAMPWAIWKLKGQMDVTYDWAILRALLGFALGTLIYAATQSARGLALAGRMPFAAATIAEVFATLAAVAFVWFAGPTPISIAAPFVFSITVAVFSAQRGALSRALLSPPGQRVGELSYSIYLLQFPLQELLVFGAVWLEATGRVAQGSLFAIRDGRPVLGATPFVGDVSAVVMLAILITLSAITYRWIERPSREWVRAAVRRGIARAEHHEPASS